MFLPLLSVYIKQWSDFVSSIVISRSSFFFLPCSSLLKVHVWYMALNDCPSTWFRSLPLVIPLLYILSPLFMVCASGYKNVLSFAMISTRAILIWLINVTGEVLGGRLLLLILQVIWWYLWVLLKVFGFRSKLPIWGPGWKNQSCVSCLSQLSIR